MGAQEFSLSSAFDGTTTITEVDRTRHDLDEVLVGDVVAAIDGLAIFGLHDYETRRASGNSCVLTLLRTAPDSAHHDRSCGVMVEEPSPVRSPKLSLARRL